jgi:anti-anti-sigma factor
MNAAASVFGIEEQGDALILTPPRDLDELGYRQVEAGVDGVLELLESAAVKNVILDLQRTACFSTPTLGLLVKLGKGVGSRQGRMAFCNTSVLATETLRTTGLDQLWPLYSSREEALRAIRT